MSGKCDRVEVVSKLLESTGGRDQLMGVVQFLPIALLPVVQGNSELAKSLENLAALSGTYRSVTRMSGAFSMLAKGVPQVKPTPESVLAFLSWVSGLCFFPAENTAALAGQGVVSRLVPEEKKAAYGGRATYFWFWSLAFENASHVFTLLKLQKEAEAKEDKEGKEDMKKKINVVLGKLIQSVFWFIMAWGCQPKTGGAQLLSNPETSVFRPLHLFVEATTVPGITLGPFTNAIVGLIPTALAINDITKDM